MKAIPYLKILKFPYKFKLKQNLDKPRESFLLLFYHLKVFLIVLKI